MTRITMRILRIKNFIKDKGLRIKDLFHYFVDSAVRGSEEPSGSRRDSFVGSDRKFVDSAVRGSEEPSGSRRDKFVGSDRNQGFTFIELIMVIVIFSIFSGVVMFNFGDFSDSISIQNLAQQIALEIKQAQSDAIMGKDASVFTGTCDTMSCRPSYGVSFNASPSQNKQFIYFADLYNDNDGDLSSPLKVINIERGNYIESISICFVSGACSDSNSVSITFIRPFPTAHFSKLGVSSVKVVVKSPRSDATRTITVTSLGQISVK